MERTDRTTAIVIAAIFCTASLSSAVQVTVDRSVTYQTIEGMGACGLADNLLGNFTDERVDSLVRVFGATLARPMIHCSFEPQPGVFDLDGSGLRGAFGVMQRLKAVADAAHEPLRICPNVFSPPAFMKVNHSCPALSMSDPDNRLDTSYANAFGDFIARYIRIARDTFGIDIYAVSPQNEPGFDEMYESCQYSTAAVYRNMLLGVGPRVRALGYGTLIFGTEGMANMFPLYERPISRDSVAGRYLDRFAVHGFTDGIHVDSTTFDTLRPYGARPLWVSEFDDQVVTYGDAFSEARSMLKMLVLSKASAVMLGGQFWGYSDVKYPRYWTAAQFFRFVRPGMKAMKATSPDSSLMVGAFGDEAAGSMSLVCVNSSAQAASVTLAAATTPLPDSFSVRTTDSANCFIDHGVVSSSSTLTVPAMGILSLGFRNVGQLPSAVRPKSAGLTAVRQSVSRTPVRRFDLRGRELDGRNRSGAGVEVRLDAASRATLAAVERHVR